MTPRCGKPMRRYEAVHGALIEDPLCGRAWNHPGPCRTEMSLARMREKNPYWHPRGSPALASVIREARGVAGLSQRDLARTLGVSQRTVGAWERAERRAAERVLAWVAVILASARERSRAA